jgi:putative ABC transport system permease protein
MIALRRLARRPSFTLPAIATLAVGVGATTAIFSTVNAALLQPLPYPQAEDIYVLAAARIDGGWSNGYLSNAELNAIASAPSVMEVAGTMGSGTDVLVADDGRNRRLAIRVVTEGFFDLAGAPLVMGTSSAIDPGEDSYGAVVLSHRIWDDVFAGDPEIVGGTLRFPSGSATIVGVAPPDFDLPEDTDVWEIFAPSPTSDARVYTGLVRVRPGTAPDVLRTELAAVMDGRVDDGLDAGGRAFVATPLVESIVEDLGPILWIVLAAATVLLALGCANVAALILARGGAQTREFAIRKALGASRASVSRQLLTESLLLSGLGTGIGLLLAYGGVRVLSALGADGLPRLDRVTFDVNVLLVAVAMLVTTAALVGLLPMMRLTRLDVRRLLGEGGRSVAGERGSGRLLSGLVVAEIAMAIVLVASAGWLVRSYANLTETDPGFVPQSRLVFRTMLVGTSYMPIERIVHDEDGTYLVDDRSGETPETWLRDLRARLEELNDFGAVGVASVAPFRQEPAGVQYVSAPGREVDPNAPDLTRFRFVTPDFFEAIGIRLLAGRTFVEGDPATTVVVNDAFVRAYLAGRDPIGQTFQTGFEPGAFTAERTIVGVVADVRFRSLREPETPAYYMLRYTPNGFVVVSTALSDPTPLIPAVRAAVDAVEPGIPITIEPLEHVVSRELARHRLGLLLMALFAAVSLLLAGIGIHGVVGHGTSLRSTEFAVRIAVGARPSHIAGSVLKQGGALWLLGISLGLGLAYVAGRLGASWLHEVRAADPLILAAAVSAVSALTFAAFSLAALRGARVEPGRVLKAD